MDLNWAGSRTEIEDAVMRLVESWPSHIAAMVYVTQYQRGQRIDSARAKIREVFGER